jgi:hypothetical protein
VGLPLLLLGATLGVWLFANFRGFRSSEPTRTTWHRPDSDPVSQTFYALEDRAYSLLIGAVYDRFDRAVQQRWGVGLSRLGWRPWPTSARRVSNRRTLLGIRDGLSARYTESVGREGPFRVRWNFWRSAAEDQALYLARVDRVIARAEEMVHQLESPT